MIRADQERRRALAAIANLGATDRNGIERFRMVIYLTGNQEAHAVDIEHCEAFVTSNGWETIAVRSDPDASQWAWLRTGLLSTITMICHLNADGVLMPDSVFNALSADDCSFLFNRLNRWGGFLRTIPDEGEDARNWNVATTQPAIARHLVEQLTREPRKTTGKRAVSSSTETEHS